MVVGALADDEALDDDELSELDALTEPDELDELDDEPNVEELLADELARELLEVPTLFTLLAALLPDELS